jgi:hypothetical protein
MGLGSGIRDPRSEIRDPEKTYSGSQITDPGVKKAPDPGSATLVLAIKKFKKEYFCKAFLIVHQLKQ